MTSDLVQLWEQPVGLINIWISKRKVVSTNEQTCSDGGTGWGLSRSKDESGCWKVGAQLWSFFEEKEEKVVIDSALYSSFSFFCFLSRFSIRDKVLGSHLRSIQMCNKTSRHEMTGREWGPKWHKYSQIFDFHNCLDAYLH